MSIIHLVRHGTHDEVGHVLSGRSEIPLNAAGQAEAQALLALFADAPVAAIHSSPRRRAQDTAQPLARKTGLPVITEAGLDEIDFGGFTGRTFQALAEDAAWHRWNAERGAARCPGGETMDEAVDRAMTVLFGLAPHSGAIVCVTHCDVIRGLVARLTAMPMDRIFMLACDPGSVTTLRLDEGAVTLVGLNRRAVL